MPAWYWFSGEPARSPHRALRTLRSVLCEPSRTRLPAQPPGLAPPYIRAGKSFRLLLEKISKEGKGRSPGSARAPRPPPGLGGVSDTLSCPRTGPRLGLALPSSRSPRPELRRSSRGPVPPRPAPRRGLFPGYPMAAVRGRFLELLRGGEARGGESLGSAHLQGLRPTLASEDGALSRPRPALMHTPWRGSTAFHSMVLQSRGGEGENPQASPGSQAPPGASTGEPGPSYPFSTPFPGLLSCIPPGGGLPPSTAWFCRAGGERGKTPRPPRAPWHLQAPPPASPAQVIRFRHPSRPPSARGSAGGPPDLRATATEASAPPRPTGGHLPRPPSTIARPSTGSGAPQLH